MFDIKWPKKKIAEFPCFLPPRPFKNIQSNSAGTPVLFATIFAK